MGSTEGEVMESGFLRGCGTEERNGTVEMWNSHCIFPTMILPVIKKTKDREFISYC
jgi:hypothetical protein